MHYVSVGPSTTESVAPGASPVVAFPSVFRGFSSSLNGLSGIRALYGFSRNSLTYFLSSSPVSVTSWYETLNSFVTQNGPVH